MTFRTFQLQYIEAALAAGKRVAIVSAKGSIYAVQPSETVCNIEFVTIRWNGQRPLNVLFDESLDAPKLS